MTTIDTANLFDFSAFPQIETSRLLLREIVPADQDAIFTIFGDAETARYLDDDVLTEPEQAVEIIDWVAGIFKQKYGLRWGITLKGDPDSLIGTCGYNVWHRPGAGGEIPRSGVKGIIGYDLVRGHWRQGIMTEALTAMLRFGFDRMALNRIEAEVEPGNVASETLLRKLGFRLEGTLRESGYWRGGYQDLQMFSLLRRESDLV